MVCVLILLLLVVGGQQSGATSVSPDCRDKEMMCKLLIFSIPNFCVMNQHSQYAAENCQQSCDLCQVRISSPQCKRLLLVKTAR